MEVAQRAYEIDPISALIEGTMVHPCLATGQGDEAVEYCKRAIELMPFWYYPYWALVWVYTDQGIYKEALQVFEQSDLALSRTESEIVPLVGWRGFLYAQNGSFSEAQECLDQLSESVERSPCARYEAARICAALGRTEEVFRFLEDSGFCAIQVGLDRVTWKPVRDDPRFHQFLRGMNFPEETVEAILTE